MRAVTSSSLLTLSRVEGAELLDRANTRTSPPPPLRPPDDAFSRGRPQGKDEMKLKLDLRQAKSAELVSGPSLRGLWKRSDGLPPRLLARSRGGSSSSSGSSNSRQATRKARGRRGRRNYNFYWSLLVFWVRSCAALTALWLVGSVFACGLFSKGNL